MKQNDEEGGREESGELSEPPLNGEVVLTILPSTKCDPYTEEVIEMTY